MARAALSARDNPLHPPKPWPQVEPPEQGLARQKVHSRRHTEEDWDAQLSALLVLDAGTQPDVLPWPLDPVRRQHTSDVHRSLREQLPVEPGCVVDQFPELRAHVVQEWMPFENVRHAGAEHELAFALLGGGCIPFERFTPVFRPEEASRSFAGRPPDHRSGFGLASVAPAAIREGGGIAVDAAR